MSIGAGSPKFRICVTMSAGTNEKVTPGNRFGSDIRRSWMYSAVGRCPFPSDSMMSAPIGPGDADIMLSLGNGHRPTAEYIHDLRMSLPKRFPGVTFSFVPADIVTQILNFGLPAPIDIQVVGRDLANNRKFAASLLTRLAQIPGITDLRVHQEFN